MLRRPRVAPDGLVYRALNRAVARLPLFQKDANCDAFLRVMAEALDRHPTRLLAFCIMPKFGAFRTARLCRFPSPSLNFAALLSPLAPLFKSG